VVENLRIAEYHVSLRTGILWGYRQIDLWPEIAVYNRQLNMIEPLTAFALAGNIVQFVEVGYKVTHILQQLWKGSATDENLEIEIAIEDMDDICTKLVSTSKIPTVTSKDDEKLRILAQSCQKLSREIDAVLQKLVVKSRANGSKRKLEVLQKALKSMLEIDKIKDLQKRLGALREQISVRMMYILT
jgi:hypothetical protein